MIYSLSYCDFPIVCIKNSCVHSPTPVFTNNVTRYPTLKTHKNGLSNNATICSLLVIAVLCSVFNGFVVFWINSSSPISDGESQITQYTKTETTAVVMPGVINAADQP